MKKEWILIPVSCLAVALCGVVEAQGAGRDIAPGKSVRIDAGKRVGSATNIGRATRSGAPSRGISSARRGASSRDISSARRGAPSRGMSSAGRPATRGNARTPSVRRPSPRENPGLNGGRVPGTTRNPFDNSHLSDNPLGALLGQYLNNGYGGGHRYDPYEGEKARAEAYRDAAIANAVVDVVGILVTASQPRAHVVAAGPEAPRGHVERQRVLVREGRTEEYQVWVPEHTIPETGEIVAGHHETRRRDIPPLYEEREVWVPASRR